MKQAIFLFLLIAAVSTAAQRPVPDDAIGNQHLPSTLPCDPSIPSCCSQRCNDDENCLYECYFATGQALRALEQYADAVKFLQVAAQINPEKGAQAVIDSIYQEQRIWMYQDGKFAIATPLGRLITPFKFPNSPEPFRKGVAIYSDENGKYFFVDKDGNELTPKPGFDAVIPTEGNLFFVKNENQMAVMTESGLNPAYWTRISRYNTPNSFQSMGPWKALPELYAFAGTIAGKYESVQGFYSAAAIVNKGGYKVENRWRQQIQGGSWGLIDTTGNETLPAVYQSVSYQGNGFFRITLNEKSGLVNSRGRKTLEPVYESIELIGPGLVRVEEKNQYGLADTNGITIVPSVYTSISDNSNYSLIEAEKTDSVKGGQWSGVIDLSGNVVVPFVYQSATVIDSLHFAVRKQDKWGMIDRTGKPLIPLQYASVEKINDHLWKVNVGGEGDPGWGLEGGKWGILDTVGKVILPIEYEEIENDEEGLITILKHRKTGLLDSTGRMIVPCDFDELENILPGNLIALSLNDKTGAINWKGDVVIPFNYDDLSDMDGRYIRAKVDTLSGLLDTLGGMVLPLEYQNVYTQGAGKGLIYIRKKGLYGWLGKDAREIVAPVYNSIDPIDNKGLAVCNKNGLRGMLDSTGKEIIPTVYDTLVYAGTDLVCVKKQGAWFFVDLQHRRMVTPQPVNEYLITLWESNYKWFKRNSLFGLMDLNGREITPPVYETVGSLKNGRALAVKDKNILLVDTLGRETDIPDYKEMDLIDGGLIGVTNDSLWGMIDTNGREVLPPVYSNIDFFDENTLVVKKDTLYGLINRQGNEIVHPKYSAINPLDGRSGLFGVATTGDPDEDPEKSIWGLIDSTGREVLPCMYNAITGGCRGRFWVKKDSAWHYIDETRQNLPVPDTFSIVVLFSITGDRCLYKAQKNDLWGLIDQDGRVVVAPSYNKFGRMYRGLASVRKGKLWGLLDSTGREMLSCNYGEIGSNFGGNMSVISTANGIISIDNYSEYRLGYGLDYLIPTCYFGVTWVKKSGLTALIDTAENEIIPPIYEQGEAFRLDVAKVRNRGKYGYVNYKGKEIVPCTFDRSYMTARDCELLIRGNKKGLFYIREQTYIPCDYEEIAQPLDDWVMVRKNNKWGWVNHSGEVQIPCRYDAATQFNAEGWATVFQFGMQFRINKNGEMIWEK